MADQIDDNKHIVEEIEIDSKKYYVDRNKTVFNDSLQIVGIMRFNNKIEFLDRKKKILLIPKF
jgi:hypothetical protein